ncbi:Hypothetical protein FKW44_018503, partial [Caligus rogercresseyi]
FPELQELCPELELRKNQDNYGQEEGEPDWMDPKLSVLLWSSNTYKFVEAEEPLVKEEFEEIFKAEPIDDFLTHRMRSGHY